MACLSATGIPDDTNWPSLTEITYTITYVVEEMIDEKNMRPRKSKKTFKGQTLPEVQIAIEKFLNEWIKEMNFGKHHRIQVTVFADECNKISEWRIRYCDDVTIPDFFDLVFMYKYMKNQGEPTNKERAEFMEKVYKIIDEKYGGKVNFDGPVGKVIYDEFDMFEKNEFLVVYVMPNMEMEYDPEKVAFLLGKGYDECLGGTLDHVLQSFKDRVASAPHPITQKILDVMEDENKFDIAKRNLQRGYIKSTIMPVLDANIGRELCCVADADWLSGGTYPHLSMIFKGLDGIDVDIHDQCKQARKRAFKDAEDDAKSDGDLSEEEEENEIYEFSEEDKKKFRTAIGLLPSGSSFSANDMKLSIRNQAVFTGEKPNKALRPDPNSAEVRFRETLFGGTRAPSESERKRVLRGLFDAVDADFVVDGPVEHPPSPEPEPEYAHSSSEPEGSEESEDYETTEEGDDVLYIPNEGSSSSSEDDED